MPEESSERRLTDASQLTAAIESLGSVHAIHRPKFVHDRLVSTIDDACAKNLHQGKPAFNAAQIAILKDVSYYIVHMLDPANRKPQGAIASFRAEWAEYPISRKVVTVSAILAFLWTLGTNAVPQGRGAIEWVKSLQTSPSSATATSSPAPVAAPGPTATVIPAPPQPIAPAIGPPATK